MNIRIKFKKTGPIKFIGHLDIMRYFQKAMRRAEVDIRYSEGFNPHQIMSFAAPLGVGITSEGEYLDISVHSTESSKAMIDKLNRVMVDGIEILEYVKLEDKTPSAMSIVAAADYLVSFREGYEPDFDWNDKFVEFMNQESIVIMKKTKKSEKEIDLKAYIYEYEIREDGLFLQLATGSVINIKPELVMNAFADFLSVEFKPFSFQVHRFDIYAHDDETNTFFPLWKLGEIIE